MAKLIDAAGCGLAADIQHQPPQSSKLSGPVGWQVRRKRRDLLAVAAAHAVANLPVFGSVARGEDRLHRDVDLLTARIPHVPTPAAPLRANLPRRRRLILTTRSFAQTRRTYDSLAAELGVGRERVRQLETAALRQLADAAAHDRYRLLRWSAASAARPDRPPAAVIPDTPPWLRNMLSWLAGRLA